MEVCGWQGTGTKIGRLGAHVWSLTVVCVYGMTTASPQLMPCIHFFLSLVNGKRRNSNAWHCAWLQETSGAASSVHGVLQTPHGVASLHMMLDAVWMPMFMIVALVAVFSFCITVIG